MPYQILIQQSTRAVGERSLLGRVFTFVSLVTMILAGPLMVGAFRIKHPTEQPTAGNSSCFATCVCYWAMYAWSGVPTTLSPYSRVQRPGKAK